jgi:hypothetical protein
MAFGSTLPTRMFQHWYDITEWNAYLTPASGEGTSVTPSLFHLYLPTELNVQTTCLRIKENTIYGELCYMCSLHSHTVGSLATLVYIFSVAFGPQANYTDCAAATYWRS